GLQLPAAALGLLDRHLPLQELLLLRSHAARRAARDATALLGAELRRPDLGRLPVRSLPPARARLHADVRRARVLQRRREWRAVLGRQAVSVGELALDLAG